MTAPTLTPIEYAEIELRRERDRLLSETDWVVTKSIEQGTSVPVEWASYRQALRDLPQNATIQLNRYDHLDWSVITLPAKPE